MCSISLWAKTWGTLEGTVNESDWFGPKLGTFLSWFCRFGAVSAECSSSAWEFKGLPVSNFTSLSFRGSHSKHAQGAGLVLQAQDAVSYPLQMAGQSHADVLNIPVEERQNGVEEELRTYFPPGLVPTVSTCILPASQSLGVITDSFRVMKCQPRVEHVQVELLNRSS